MDSNKVILVDESDSFLGLMDKMEVHSQGLLHRAVSVFIFNTEGLWLLQQRAVNKYHSGGLWTNACCSHPLPGESTFEAAHRRLKEEMGLETALYSAFSFIYRAELDNNLTEHEFDHVFIGYCNSKPTVNPDEAMDYSYTAYNVLEVDIKNNPQNYTEWFKKIAYRVNDFVSANSTLNLNTHKKYADKLD